MCHLHLAALRGQLENYYDEKCGIYVAANREQRYFVGNILLLFSITRLLVKYKAKFKA